MIFITERNIFLKPQLYIFCKQVSKLLSLLNARIKTRVYLSKIIWFNSNLYNINYLQYYYLRKIIFLE